MTKQEIRKTETHVTTRNAVGKQLEQTYTVDDSLLPSAQDLKAYKEIDPRIVDYLIEASNREQQHRHSIETGNMGLIQKVHQRDARMRWWGMFFAFLSLAVMMGVAAYALYLNKFWISGIILTGTIVSIVSIFTNTAKKNSGKRNTKT